MENKLIELLTSIGFSQNEVEVYLDLLKNHASTAYSIAQRIGSHRSSVYESLRKLQQRGIIVEIKEENRNLYQTKEHTAIEEYLKQKQAELQEILPYLKEVSVTEIPSNSISVSYGLTPLKTALVSLFNFKKEILIWTLPKNADTLFGADFLKEMNETMTKKQVSAKIISSRHFDNLKEISKNPLIEVRYIDEETNIFTIVCGDIVLLIVLSNPLTIIEMNNSNIAEGFESRFVPFWEKARKKESQ